jgi:hypothetical protein
MSIARVLLAEVLAVLEHEPALAERVRRLFAPALPPSVDSEYETVRDFAARIGVSERHVFDLRKRRQIVTIGQGRSLRVDVRASLTQLREHRDDGIEREARAAARRAAGRVQ